MSHHLQGVADGDGEKSAVKDRSPAAQNFMDIRVFEEEHQDDADQSGNNELIAGEADRVTFWRTVVDDHNLQRKEKCAEADKEIAFLQGEVRAVHAKQVEAGHTHQDTEPDDRADFFTDRDRKNRDFNCVQGGNEAGFADCRKGDAVLLERRSGEQNDTEGD